MAMYRLMIWRGCEKSYVITWPSRSEEIVAMVEKRKRSPEELAEARRASAKKYSDRCIRLGMMFHVAQQESFDGWVALDEWADAQGGEPT